MQVLNTETVSRPQLVKKAVEVLEKSGIIIFPTETCYGAGVDATNKRAVAKLLQYKGGRANKPISVAVADLEMAQKFVRINSIARHLYRNLLPGPLTVISASRGQVASQLESNNKTLGIRIPDNPLTLEIIRTFNKPLTATSANTSGKKPPYCLKDLIRYTTEKRLEFIDLFLDAGRLAHRLPTTVVDTTLNAPNVIRQGEITIKAAGANTFVSNSEKQTLRIAQNIFKKHRSLLSNSPLLFALQGELGAGKTVFAKGLGSAVNIKANINSPTYTLIKQYPYRLQQLRGTFYHIDTWRMHDGKELLKLGLASLLQPHNLIAIEWLQKVKNILQKFQPQTKIVWVLIKRLSLRKRQITFQTGKLP